MRYNAQIHSIIVALSLHVVVLIKDLNGNHVIQKCLNKLSPEDNQVHRVLNVARPTRQRDHVQCIQNKLQREQMDFAGYRATLVNMASQRLALAHANRANHDPPQALHQPNSFADVYAAQNPVYVPSGSGSQTQRTPPCSADT